MKVYVANISTNSYEYDETAIVAANSKEEVVDVLSETDFAVQNAEISVINSATADVDKPQILERFE